MTLEIRRLKERLDAVGVETAIPDQTSPNPSVRQPSNDPSDSISFDVPTSTAIEQTIPRPVVACPQLPTNGLGGTTQDLGKLDLDQVQVELCFSQYVCVSTYPFVLM